MVIDCRFDYEYKGGHIKGAVNIRSPEELERTFFGSKETMEDLMR
jgi:rhodanese-related sulfurtransferase